MAAKAFEEELKGQLEELCNKNPLPKSTMTNLTMTFSDNQLADSKMVQGQELLRKRDNERNKTISLMYLFSQPLIEKKTIDRVVHEIYPMNVVPLDNYGEYR